MKAEDIDFVRELVRRYTGQRLGRDKAYLFESSLVAVARRHELDSPEELVALIQARRGPSLVREVTEAITGKESSFFRDFAIFEFFRTAVLPRFAAQERAARPFRLWCAACGSGAETYSLAMILADWARGLPGWTYEIVATDISTGAIEKAKAGLYSQFEIQRGLPVDLLLKYFRKFREVWQVDASLRARVTFLQHDLRTDQPPEGPFDVVFCRYVLTFFKPSAKVKALARIAEALPDGGMLFLGTNELVPEKSEGFEPLPGVRSVYRRRRQ